MPTGIVVTCQSERSQQQNRDRAMRILLRAAARRWPKQQAHSEMAAERRSQVGTGDRSEKIRTYNFPQNRITDHRINFTTHGIQQVMDGDIDDLDRCAARGGGRTMAKAEAVPPVASRSAWLQIAHAHGSGQPA